MYFKFNSWNQSHFDTISLDLSPMISVGELKQLISKKKKLEKNTGLVLTNAQTGEGSLLTCFIDISTINSFFSHSSSFCLSL